jgi:uncharacterized membrane protein YtjA (UPF0391 family)
MKAGRPRVNAGNTRLDHADRLSAVNTVCYEEEPMPAGNFLYYALVALVIALIAAFFGFSGVAGTAAGIAQILFYIFLIIFVVVLIMNFVGRGRGPTV